MKPPVKRGGLSNTEDQRRGRRKGGKSSISKMTAEQRSKGGKANTESQREARSKTGRDAIKVMNSLPNTLLNQKKQGRRTKNLVRNDKKVLCVETGMVYSSAHEASRETKVHRPNITSCCLGKRQVAGGFHWKHYIEENK